MALAGAQPLDAFLHGWVLVETEWQKKSWNHRKGRNTTPTPSGGEYGTATYVHPLSEERQRIRSKHVRSTPWRPSTPDYKNRTEQFDPIDEIAPDSPCLPASYK